MSAGNAIRRLAILNRGEAAIRCIRSVKALRALENSDLESIAIYTATSRRSSTGRSFLIASARSRIVAHTAAAFFPGTTMSIGTALSPY